MPSPEALALNPDYDTAMEALSQEERNALENMRASMNQDEAESFRAGEAAYDRAVRLEDMRGLDTDSLDEYTRASRYLIGATTLNTLVAREPEGAPAPINPVIYLKIADSLTKRATAPASISDVDRFVVFPDVAHEGKPVQQRKYLAELAFKYWDRGIEALLEADPNRPPTGVEIPQRRSELIVSAFNEAVKDTDAKQEHAVVVDASEEELTAQLEEKGPEELLSEIPKQTDRLEVVSLTSQRINGELEPSKRSLSLAA